MNNKGQFSIIAALLVAVVLISTVIITYSTIRNSPIQDQPQILSAIDETNFAIKQILGFTVGYYCSVLQVTGNSSYARMLAINYLHSGLINIADIHPEWGASFKVSKTELYTYWFTNTSYSTGTLAVTYNLTGLGIYGITYEISCRLTVQAKSIISSNQTQLVVMKDEGEPLINLGKRNFEFYRYVYTNSTWELITPSTEPVAFANGTYIIDIPSGIDPYSYLIQVEDSRGLIVVVSSFSRYICTLAWNSTARTQNYVDNNTADEDSSADKGTHSNFPAQQYGPDSIYDTLTENNEGESGYKVQQGRTLITATQQDITISEVSSLNRAFVMFNHYYSSGQRDQTPSSSGDLNPDTALVSAYLVDTAHIRVNRHSSTSHVYIDWQVIECLDGEFEVYRGSHDWSTSSGTSFSTNIGATVTPANCLAWVSGTTTSQSSLEAYDTTLFRAYVSSSTQITIQRKVSDANTAGTLRWVVVEFDTSKIDGIQTGTTTVTNSHTQSNPRQVALGTPINISSSILLFQIGVADSGLDQCSVAGRIASSTTIEFYTHGVNTQSRDIRYYVIDFGSGCGSKQSGTIDYSGNSNWYNHDETLSPSVTVNRTISFTSLTQDGSGTAFPRPFPNTYVGTSTNYNIWRSRYGQESWIEWQVLELPYSTGETNYELDLEVQWTNAYYNGTNEELCIYGGTMGSEDIQVDVWNGSTWKNLFTDLSSGWNNVSVSSYLDSSTFTIRFKGSNETSDIIQDNWKIDATLLHVWPSEDLYLSLQDATIVVELLQNGTMRWLGQNLQLTTQTKPIPPIPVKAIHMNQTVNGMNREIPFQIEDWASNYRIPLGLTSNASVFNSRTMLVFLANPNVSKVTIWWNGSDAATQTPNAYINKYFSVNTAQRTLSNGILDLTIDFSDQGSGTTFKVKSTMNTSTATAEFMRINNEVADYGDSEPTYAITNGTVRAVIHHEVEWDGGILNPDCPNVYAHIVLMLPANVTYYTYQLRFMFVESQRDRNITDLCPIKVTASTGQPQTENGTANGYPTISNSTGLFYNFSASSWAHHWSQFILGNSGAGILFTDNANEMLYVFDSIAGNKTGALRVSNSTERIIELLPVSDLASVNFTYALDVTWYGAVVTFDGTTPIYDSSNKSGLWITVEYPPTITVTTES